MKLVYKEANLQADIIMYLEALGYVADNIMVTSKEGISDVIACIHGRYCVIEVKLEYNNPTPMQERKQERVRLAGGYAIIAKSLEDVRKLVNMIRTAHSNKCALEPFSD